MEELQQAIAQLNLLKTQIGEYHQEVCQQVYFKSAEYRPQPVKRCAECNEVKDLFEFEDESYRTDPAGWLCYDCQQDANQHEKAMERLKRMREEE